ncbi:CDP-diacylglycerolinsitol-3-phosphatidyltransferase [Spraguea lophii 42_110]|uniref:CDP-diacylglycerolinsitol-3-phosphatidyltransferase n=1 Tax=Spraguea lophii (strain 42_110) TaxID=1358809 RepID=S7W905_SPRLO|nr:CDP-diacylglycerolinsitol-3-phosphatidyltransferase [Spraguea lophii 42_110]
MTSLFTYANILCYIRFYLNICSIFASGIMFIILHLLSSSIDLIDGFIARKFNQVSILGRCLDMFNDRLGYLIIIFKCKNIATHVFLLYIIDFISNSIYFASHLFYKTEFKKSKNIFLRHFYKEYLFVPLCAGTELYFSSLYLSYYYPKFIFIKDILFCFYIMKSFFHCNMFLEAFKVL